MYLLLKDGDSKFIWDDEKAIMYQVSEEGDTEVVKANLEKLTRFCPYLELISESEEFPSLKK